MSAPPVPPGVTGEELDREVRDELRDLPPRTATRVAQHLVAAGRLLDEDPEAAYAHAKAAQGSASRLPATREALGLAAYLTGRYAEALAELRTARRLSGSNVHLPLLADVERGLGRPERALALAGSPDARGLDRAGQLEMRIVAAGARRDLGQLAAAVVTLQVPQLHSSATTPEIARLRYAYADALLAVGRREEALAWFQRAAEADPEGDTDAGERAAQLEGLTFLDALDDNAEDDAEDDAGDAEPTGTAPPAAGSA